MNLFKKTKQKAFQLTTRAKNLLEISANAMQRSFGLVQRKAIRVAPYAALAVPGGIAVSKYFTAYNHLLDSQAAYGNLVTIATQTKHFADDLILQIPFAGMSRDEIVSKYGEAVAREFSTRAENVEAVFAANPDLKNAYEQANAAQVYTEIPQAFGFETFEAMLEEYQTNEVLREGVNNYYTDIIVENAVELSTQAPLLQHDIIFNGGTEFESAVEHPFTEKALEAFNEQVQELNAAQIDAQIGTVLAAATAAVGVGMYAAQKVYKNHKSKTAAKASSKNTEIEREQ